MNYSISFHKMASIWVVLSLIGAVSSRLSPAGWLENWDTSTSNRFITLEPGESQAQSNSPDAAAEDGKALALILAANPGPGPGNGPEVETVEAYRYGTFTSRLKTANCSAQPRAGVVTGYFVYFNDGGDTNGDGLPDNTEIDFEWLCAEPGTIYLTMWTDYRDSDTAHKRVARKIDLQSGEIAYTCYFESFDPADCQPLSGPEAQPVSISPMPGYDSSQAYYEYGFEWTNRRVTWWIVDPESGERLILWDYQGLSRRIPQQSAYFMTNLWHTENWAPDGQPDAIQSPQAPVSAFVDWARFEPIFWHLYLPVQVFAQP